LALVLDAFCAVKSLELFELHVPSYADAKIRKPGIGPNSLRKLEARLEQRGHYWVAFIDCVPGKCEGVIKFPGRRRRRRKNKWLHILAYRSCKRLLVQALSSGDVPGLIIYCC
jgi:hypothetical protein